MKQLFVTVLTVSLLVGYSRPVAAQTEEIAQLLLNVEKLAQFKQILSDMKKGYDILNGGYQTVKRLSEGNFSIHRAFLDGLMEVSPAVRDYRKVAGIIEYQVLLVKEYRTALRRFKASGSFQTHELAYLELVYKNLFDQSLRNLDELAMVVTAGKLRMSDEERLETIDRIFGEMEEKVAFLRHFNNGNQLLLLQREKQHADIRSSRALHGLEP